MSGSTQTQGPSSEKLSKRQKAAIWLNNLFRTRLEIETDKLAEMFKESNDNQVQGQATFFHSRSGLEKSIVEGLGGDPKYVKLGDLSISYWCDLPKKVFTEFQNDGQTLMAAHKVANDLTNRLVAEWVKRAKVWERVATEAEANKDEAGVKKALAEFQKDCIALQKECEQAAQEALAAFFQDKVKTFADYKRYKVKAGAKLVFTCVGIVISIAALSTAATPAAPATLVPAIIGLVSSVASAAKQATDLALSAETVAKHVGWMMDNLEVNYRDEKGKAKKKTYKAKDLASGFIGGLSGGWSELAFPSVKSIQGEIGLHKSKLDGLETTMHQLSINLNATVDSMVNVSKVLDDNLKKLNDVAKTKPGDKDVAKALKDLGKAQTTFAKVNEAFLTQFDKVVELNDRVNEGREKNKLWDEKITAIDEAIGSANWAMAGSILASLSLLAIGFASGAPTNLAEKITMPITVAFTGTDLIREYSPDVMEKIFG